MNSHNEEPCKKMLGCRPEALRSGWALMCHFRVAKHIQVRLAPTVEKQ